jgi:hypothetical protein
MELCEIVTKCGLKTIVLITVSQRYRTKIQSERSAGILLAIVDQLFDTQAPTVAQTVKRFNLTTPTAQQNINTLTAAGILKEAAGRLRNLFSVKTAYHFYHNTHT